MINRRDLFKFAAGSAAGAMFTPLPWKLLDDSAIWTQTGPMATPLPRGPVTVKFTHCTLCEVGCAMKARCVGERPVSVAGIAGDPVSGGKLCTMGVVAHHLPYHPLRARGVLRDGKPSELPELLKEARAARGSLAILDGRPGRAVSELYRKFAAAVPGAMHLTPRQSMLWGADLENTRLVLSFGVPVMEDWTAPGRAWAARGGFRLLQVEPRQSATAMMADRWIPVGPGYEETFALAVGGVMLREGWHQRDLERTAEDFAEYRRKTAEALASVGDAAVMETARDFAGTRPAIALGGGAAGWALNILSGNVGRKGGWLQRRPLWPEGAIALTAVKDGSVGVLLVDADTPYEDYAGKLARGAVVVELSPFPSARGGWTVPPPVFTETLEDTPAAPEATCGSLRLSPALLKPPLGAVPQEALLAVLADAYGVEKPGTVEDIVQQRVAAIYASRRGSVTLASDGSAKTVTEHESAAKLQEALLGGAWWTDEEARETPLGRRRLMGAEAPQPARPELALVVTSPRVGRPVSPLLSKLYQESALRPPPDLVRVNPGTGASQGLADGSRVRVQTARGEALTHVRFDAAVMPDVLEGGTQLAAIAGPVRIWRV